MVSTSLVFRYACFPLCFPPSLSPPFFLPPPAPPSPYRETHFKQFWPQTAQIRMCSFSMTNCSGQTQTLTVLLLVKNYLRFARTYIILLTLARACAAKGYCSRSVGLWVGLWVCPHVFSRTVAAVDTKRGYVGMYNGRSAQQESGAALSKNSMFTAGV